MLFPSNTAAFESLLPHSSTEAERGRIDFSYLPFEYHQALVGGLALSPALVALGMANANVLCLPCRGTRNRLKAVSGSVNLTLIGLGGGGLAMFFADCLQFPPSVETLAPAGAPVPAAAVRVTAIELDPAVTHVAQRWFGCDHPAVTCVVADGIAWVHDRVRQIAAAATPDALRMDVMCIDVDNKDLNDKALSFPPRGFVEVEYFQALRACLRPGGLLLV